MIGIDPGLEGGIAIISDAVKVIKMPTLINKKGKKELDILSIIKFLKESKIKKAYIEQVGAMPGQGVTSMFNFGMGYGILLGVLTALKIKYVKVIPQKWKGIVLEGTEKDKEAAIQFCQKTYPEVNLIPEKCRTPSDGMADALCIAAYGLQFEGSPDSRK